MNMPTQKHIEAKIPKHGIEQAKNIMKITQ